jgi:flagellar secretion chaperone FliS
LFSLYEFCIFRVTDANLHNDPAMVEEVLNLIRPVADGWTKIAGEVASPSRSN